MNIEIKPAPRSNPDGLPNLPWNIWKDGRNTNVKPTKRDAELSAGILDIDAHLDGEYDDEEPTEASYMRVARPRGAPKIGERILYTFLDESVTVDAVVTEYLSTQFLISYKWRGHERDKVVSPNENFVVVEAS